jgi:hypothetical protein
VKFRLLVAIIGLTLCAANSRPPPKSVADVAGAYLPDPLFLKLLGKSQLDFVADLFWVRMANAAGNARTREDYTTLLPLANLIADIAPKFRYSYYVGGVLAPVRQGRTHEYWNAKEAVALMNRGVDAIPDYGRLAIQKSFAELEMLHDPATAGRTLQKASRLADVPAFTASLATRLLAQSGQIQDARAFAEEMAQSADPQVRQDFELRVRQINLEEQLQRVDDAAARFEKERGTRAATIDELIAGGFLSAVPFDPLGGTIILTPEGARSTVEEQRLRAFTAREE